MRKIIQLVGNRYGKLVVIKWAGKNKTGIHYWLCKCDCGNEKKILRHHLVNGRTKSCGCMRKGITQNSAPYPIPAENNPIYKIWSQMKTRCYNKKSKSYKHYGAKGVRVFEEWRKNFTAFSEYVGERPSPKHSLDRFPNNKGNYEPGNLRWATPIEQAYNKRNTLLLTYNGETKPYIMWANELNITISALKYRIKNWPLHKVMTTSKRN